MTSPQPDALRLFSLAGKVALISGASRGIGHAIARGLASAGATVTGFARSSQPESGPASGFGYRSCDVNDTSSVRGLVEDVYHEAKRLDVFVHAAGVSFPSPSAMQSLAEFEETLRTNLTSAYAIAREIEPMMGASGGGSIIHITSIGSALGFPNNPAYVAAKGGLRLLTRALALDLAGRKIRVNAIAPGYVRTAMTEESHNDPQLHAERVSRMMIKRWATPEDLVGAAIFLASDASSYVTGQDIFVDGGWTAKGL